MATKDITDLQVLIAHDIWKKNPTGLWSYEILAEQTGESIKVCYRALQRAGKRGLLECGVTIRTAWFTKKGKEMLEQHEKTIVERNTK